MASPRPGAEAAGRRERAGGDVLDGPGPSNARDGGSGKVSLTLKIRRYNPELPETSRGGTSSPSRPTRTTGSSTPCTP